jgi:hypothetical protein
VTADPPSPAAARPVLRVVRGDATPEEIAALVAVLALRRPAAPEPATPARPRSEWSARSRLMRTPVFPSPGGWRRSGLPR